MAGVIVAIVLAGAAAVALVIHARRSGPAGAPPWLDRVTLGVGALAVLALGVPWAESWLARPNGSPVTLRWLLPASITIGLVALTLGIWAISSGIRSWRAWLGIGFGAIVTAFWLVFFAGELLSPH